VRIFFFHDFIQPQLMIFADRPHDVSSY
jgi:hypothetical protein